MITIVDYHVGNCSSIKNMLKRLGHNAIISDKAEIIAEASKIILPGVGSFDKGMSNIENLGLLDIITKKVNDELTPLLGICLGMQLLGKSSEEGNREGFGFVNCVSKKFTFKNPVYKVPHMGWNLVKKAKDHDLLDNFIENCKFYFVHSYYVECQNKSDILLETNYGIEFTSAIHVKNVLGVQFHPEKSHKYGMRLLDNFVKI